TMIVGRREKLDGNMTAEMGIFSHIDHAHSTFTDFFQDSIMGNGLADHEFLFLLIREECQSIFRKIKRAGSA
ncbi:MAG: hypothetical protein ABJC05_10540, partial [Pyrinomonadaceae bacterium]